MVNFIDWLGDFCCPIFCFSFLLFGIFYVQPMYFSVPSLGAVNIFSLFAYPKKND